MGVVYRDPSDHIETDDEKVISAHLTWAEDEIVPLFVKREPSKRGAIYHVDYWAHILIVQKNSHGDWQIVYRKTGCRPDDQPCNGEESMQYHKFVSVSDDCMYVLTADDKYEITRLIH